MTFSRILLPRRTILRGAGVALTLPILEAMMPVSRAAAAAAAGQTSAAAPRRFVLFRQAQGTVIEHWLPEAGPLGDNLPSLLAPYQPVKDKLTLVSNLTSSGMIGGRHYRSGHDLSSTLFTAAPAVDKKTGKASVSIDQYIAQHIGQDTPIMSLGFAQRSMSSDLFWSNESTKLPLEGNPRFVFDRIFKGQSAESSSGGSSSGGSTTGRTTSGGAGRRSRREVLPSFDADRSILDLVLGQTSSLKKNLGLNDQRQLDQYMDSVRELERRIGLYESRKTDVLAEKAGLASHKIPELPARAEDYVLDRNDPEQADRHVQIMCDLLVLAFQTDSTRVGSMDFDFGYFPDIVSVGTEYDFHTLAHHGSKKTRQGSDPVAREAVREIYYWHSKQVAYLAQRMDQIEEPDGTLLDNSLIVHTSELAFGDHFADNIPMALLGRAGGMIQSGRHVACSGVTPVSHLWTDLANRMGVPTEAFGNACDHPNNDTANLPSLG